MVDCKEAYKFLMEYQFDTSKFFHGNLTEVQDIIIDIPACEIRECDKIDLNQIKKMEEKKFFYNKFYKVVNSTYDKVVIQVSEHMYVSLDKDMIYEWDDCK